MTLLDEIEYQVSDLGPHVFVSFPAPDILKLVAVARAAASYFTTAEPNLGQRVKVLTALGALEERQPT